MLWNILEDLKHFTFNFQHLQKLKYLIHVDTFEHLDTFEQMDTMEHLDKLNHLDTLEHMDSCQPLPMSTSSHFKIYNMLIITLLNIYSCQNPLTQHLLPSASPHNKIPTLVTLQMLDQLYFLVLLNRNFHNDFLQCFNFFIIFLKTNINWCFI